MRQIQGLGADALEQFEGVGHTGENRAAVPAEQLPELVVDDRVIGEHQARAAQQVAVDHRKAVAV